MSWVGFDSCFLVRLGGFFGRIDGKDVFFISIVWGMRKLNSDETIYCYSVFFAGPNLSQTDS